MVAVVDRATTRFARLRAKRPFVDHVVRMVQHYGQVKGNLHAGAITYFAFLSFFPLLALTFFAVGLVSQVYPDANDQVRAVIQGIFPGLVGNDEGQVPLDTVRSFSGVAGVIGLVGVLYTGSGFIQVLREALTFVFERPQSTAAFPQQKLADVLAMATIGSALLISVALGGGISRLSTVLLDLVGLDDDLAWVLSGLALLVGFGVNTLLFFLMFRQLARPEAPAKSLWQGALLSAVAFELLKQVASTLLTATKEQPAFQAFGIALILLIWINYFARLTIYGASFSHTSLEAIALRSHQGDPVQGPQSPTQRQWAQAAGGPPTSLVRRSATPFAAGGAAMLALVAAIRRTQR